MKTQQLATTPARRRHPRLALLGAVAAAVGLLLVVGSAGGRQSLFEEAGEEYGLLDFMGETRVRSFMGGHRVPLSEATPASDLIELPKGCHLRTGLMTTALNIFIDDFLRGGPWPRPAGRPSRKRLVSQLGTSLLLHNKTFTGIDIGHVEIGTCWIPGPEGNRLLPDFLAVHVTGIKLALRLNYTLEQAHPWGSVQLGGGTIDTTVQGAILINYLDLHDFNNTIKHCGGLMGTSELKVRGLLNLEKETMEADDLSADQTFVQEQCNGPSYWDYGLGPRPDGLVDAINYEVRRSFWKDYVAPPPSPPPPYLCDCEWTLEFACPHSEPLQTAKTFAADDGSACFVHCCVDQHYREVYERQPAAASYGSYAGEEEGAEEAEQEGEEEVQASRGWFAF